MSELPGMWDESDLRGGEADCADDLLIVRKLKEENAALKARVAELAAPAVQEEPTDDELLNWAAEEQLFLLCEEDDFLQIAREVLHKYRSRSPAVQKPAPDVTALVEALERARDRIESERRSGEWDPLLRDIDAALAAHRKQGGGVDHER